MDASLSSPRIWLLSLLLFTWGLERSASVRTPELEEMVRRTPIPVNIRDYIPQLPPLGRKPRVACPCIGISGSSAAFHCMGIAGHFNNIWDLESRYLEALNWHLQECGMELHEIVLNLGKSTGDLLSAALEHLQPADFLIAGCPCPPWAGNGMRRSVKDMGQHRNEHEQNPWNLTLVSCMTLCFSSKIILKGHHRCFRESPTCVDCTAQHSPLPPPLLRHADQQG